MAPAMPHKRIPLVKRSTVLLNVTNDPVEKLVRNRGSTVSSYTKESKLSSLKGCQSEASARGKRANTVSNSAEILRFILAASLCCKRSGNCRKNFDLRLFFKLERGFQPSLRHRSVLNGNKITAKNVSPVVQISPPE